MILTGKAKDVLSRISLDDEGNFSQDTIEKFKSDPEFYRTFVKGIEEEINGAFPAVRETQTRRDEGAIACC